MNAMTKDQVIALNNSEKELLEKWIQQDREWAEWNEEQSIGWDGVSK